MSTLSSQEVISPANKSEECPVFVIEDAREAFTFADVTAANGEYTVSFWIKSDAVGSISIHGSTINTGTNWLYKAVTYTATDVDLIFDFETAGTYYIYHLQLESGNKATDWAPAPEDTDDRFSDTEKAIEDTQESVTETNGRVSTVEASLQLLADSVITRVTDEEGKTTTLRQTGTGWTFSLSDLEGTVSDALDALATLSEEQASVLQSVDALKTTVAEHSVLTDYVVIGEYNGQPCIELGEVGGDFKLRITNTEMYFMAGAMILTTVTNQKMVAEKIEVRQELQQGGFVWMLHGNGNLGLIWKGVDS